jgi:preprotein translocase subunit SecY
MQSNTSGLKDKIIFTLLIVLVYRVGTHIPIPGIQPDAIKNIFSEGLGSLFGMVNVFSGGALERISIFALNIMPYITASIIMQLMTSVFKTLENLKKEGPYGMQKINQYTRYLAILFSLFQAIGLYFALSKSGGTFISNSSIYMLTTVVALVGGTVILMWFGEKINESGIGNGISIIIFVGIVSSLPASISQFFKLARSGAYSWYFVILFIAGVVAFIYLIIFVERSYRKIKINYPNQINYKLSKMDNHSFLPIKMNVSGVIPPIFASSILMFPSLMFQTFSESDMEIFAFLQRGSVIYLTIFSLLIFFFSFFYSSIVLNSKDIADNLKKSNCIILGVRPGEKTAIYIDEIVFRVTCLGSLYLVFICLIPEILITKYSLPLYIGGTGLLIMVNVVIDLITNIQSYQMSSTYQKGGRRKNRRKVRIR